jgi:riboflavin synthase
MFSGIVETTGSVVGTAPGPGVLYIHIQKPNDFNDLKRGDSIAVNGICLTVEEFDAQQMRFALGPETLKITEWDASRVMGMAMNLERSLRLQDRVHGHLVTGHVDAQGRVHEAQRRGETLDLSIEFPEAFKSLIWAKGSVAINGVSLTVNQVDGARLRVGLIPETLKRTNLGNLKVGDPVNLEMDQMARALTHWAKLQQETR